jgi:phage terminase large subunit-like protein
MIADYIKDVEQGNRNAGWREKLAVQRFQELRKRYDYDETEVDRILNIIHLFKYAKGDWRGKPFNLLPHQAFFVAAIFGLKLPNNTRLIREAMLCMAKKGGKSEIDGVFSILFNFFDEEFSAENYIVANKTEQALHAFKSAKGIVTQLVTDYPSFKEDLKIYDTKMEHKILQPSTDNYIKTLPYGASSLDGVNPHLVIIDEFHEYPDTSVPDNLVSGMVLRKQPLILYSTTRGFHPYGPLAEKEEYYENVLKGKFENDSVFPLIFSLDNYDDWKKKSHWIQFAPGVDDDLPSYEVLEKSLNVALQEGGMTLNSTKVKNFNMWQKNKESYINEDDWDKSYLDFELDFLKNRDFYVGFDLGKNDDLSVVCYYFPSNEFDENHYVVLDTFMPEDLIEKLSREHKVSYSQWIRDGYVLVTEGNITDTSFMANRIEEMVGFWGGYNCKAIVADAAFATEMINNLNHRGFVAESFPQNYSRMTEPVVKIQKLVSQKILRHRGNKALSWMLSNVDVRRNQGGQMMMDKSDRITGSGKDHKRGRKKIDGAVALAMCVGKHIEDTQNTEFDAKNIVGWI